MKNKPYKVVVDEPLSFLVDYKLNIDKLSVIDNKQLLSDDLNAMLKILKQPGFFTYYLNTDLKKEASKQVEHIVDCLDKFELLLDEFKKTTDIFLRNEEKNYLAQSYRMYEEARVQDDATYILDRTLFHTLIYRDHISDDFINRIRANSTWKYPGMFIRPEHGKFIEEIQASDPLYVVDENNQLLRPIKELWNDNNRSRYGLVNDESEEIFKNYPKQQLGFITAMNFFNHKPLEIIKKYLIEIFDLLRPGGVLLFTYNNCNYPLAVKNFEKSLYSYTPETLLRPMAESLGFDIIESYNSVKTNVSWLEIKKPGVLTTLRGGQCLGKIVV